MYHPLDTWITEARQRETARWEAQRQQEAEEAAQRRQSWIEQQQRELGRALGDELLTALDCTYHTQDVYPQCFAVFTYHGVELRLWYAEERAVAYVQIRRSNTDRGQKVTLMSGREPELIRDEFLIAIGELAGF